MRRTHHLRLCVLLLSVGAALPEYAASETAAVAPSKEPAVVHFSRSVANIEYESSELTSTQFKVIRSVPTGPGGVLRFGRIRRRLPQDTPTSSKHDIPFAAAYRDGAPISFWCDLNMNGELADEKPIALYHYPAPAGARAAWVDLAWKVKVGADSIPIAWKIRVVLQPIAPPDSLPRYKLQNVFAETGAMLVDGQPRTAFLYDGNADGVYSRDYGDGLFVDADGDGEVTVDTTSPEFLPFSVATQVGGTVFETVRVDPRGSDLELSCLRGQREQRQATVGDPAPDFTFEAMDGRQVRFADYRGHPVVVYFWASWCVACANLAPALRAMYDRLHPRGLEILSISFDADRTHLASFEDKHHEPWPISFTGRGFWENPVGRLYGISTAGAACLVDSDGKFLGLYYDLEDLEEKAAELLPQAKEQGRVGSAR